MTGLALRFSSIDIAISDAPGGALGDTEDIVTIALSSRAWLTTAELDVIELQPIRGDVGLGAIVCALMRELEGGRDAVFAEHERRQLAHIIRGLVSAIAAERVDDESFSVPPKRRIVVLAMQVIHARLDDPRLTGVSIARTLGVSVRTLQVAFSDSSITVAGTVRRLRRERAVLANAARRDGEEELRDAG